LPFTFSKNCPTLKIPNHSGKPGWANPDRFRTSLWNVQTDPLQTHPVEDAAVEKKMIDHLTRLMQECDAPAEQWDRLGLA